MRRFSGSWKRVRPILARFAALGISLLISLLIGEGAVRLLRPQQLPVFDPRIYRSDPLYGWAHTPAVDVIVNTGERSTRFITDTHGNRVPSQRPSHADTRILALGDSFTEALQVDAEDSMVELVASRLAQELGRPVEAINTAVAGWGPNQYLIKAREQLHQSNYSAVVVFLFLGNDIEYRRVDQYPPKQPTVVHHLHWPRSATLGAVINAWIYPVNDALERRSHLFVLARNNMPGIKTRLIALVHAAKKGSSRTNAGLEESVLNIKMKDSPRWQLTAEICADIASEADSVGAPTLFILLPKFSWLDNPTFAREVRDLGGEPNTMDRYQPARILGRELQNQGLHFIDTTGPLEKAKAGGNETLFGRIDTHLGPAGHKLVARVTSEALFAVLDSNVPH
ncbi:MAG: SGNH/GDSL hydrolase family protein [Thermoanaerobaculia bacterium]|nr:SGNH/GDSL hydrolase family protein [Thermoanaerobaculia bacterium]